MGDGKLVLFPRELPLHPSCVTISHPWGLDPFPSQSLGPGLGDCSCVHRGATQDT